MTRKKSKELVQKSGFPVSPPSIPPTQTDLPSNVAASSPQVIDYREVGATGLKRFSGFIYEEFLPELTGWQGVRVYKEMSSNDATIGAVLFAIKSLTRKCKWFTEPASNKPQDVEAAEFLETCMNDMSQTWTDTIDEIMSMLEYGHCVNEIVYKRRCGESFLPSMRSKYVDGRIGWRKLPIRAQDTLYRWQFDDHGAIQGVEQLAPPHYLNVTIPVEKFLLFRTTTLKNDPQGRSILRTAYRSWYMKKEIENIEAIGVERDLAGLPCAWVPPELLSQNATQNSKALLSAIREIVVNVRRNAQEGVIMPLDYDQNGKPRFDFKLLSTGGTRQFDTSAIITRYDQRIAMTAMADFLLLGQDKVGSFALSSTKTNLFSTAIGSFLDIIADVFNRFAIPRLFALNDFQITNYPKIKHGDLGHVDLTELGNFIQRLAAAGMPLFPNGELEKHLLEVAGMPTAGVMEEPDSQSLQIEDSVGGGNDAPLTEIPDESPAETQPKTNESGNTELTSRFVRSKDEI